MGLCCTSSQRSSAVGGSQRAGTKRGRSPEPLHHQKVRLVLDFSPELRSLMRTHGCAILYRDDFPFPGVVPVRTFPAMGSHACHLLTSTA